MSEQKAPEARIGQQAAGPDRPGPRDRLRREGPFYPWISVVSLQEAGEDPGLQMGRAR